MSDAIDLDKLGRWLARNVDGFELPVEISRFPGGQSNPTYKLTTPIASFVMRTRPVGALVGGAHAIDREYRVIRALNASDVPVPTAYVFCDDDTVIGRSFFIMDFVPGAIHAEANLPDVSRRDRGPCFDAMNETLARLAGMR